MTTTEAEQAAMRRALDLAADSDVPPGPNPRVGCVLLDDAGRTVAEGHHRGAGTPHAEADALAQAGDAARGTTAVVTLEPCDHTGRTPPCSHALVAAGVRRVVLAQRDPNPVARGGADTLRDAGVEVVTELLAEESQALNRAWTFAVQHGRPFVTWKVAATLDGRSAAADGSSRWITGPAARRDVHRLRAQVDTVVVGTGTAATDDPALTVRDEHGTDAPHQPLRVVVGERDLDPGLRLLTDRAGQQALHLRTRDPHAVLAELAGRECRHVLLEGGPTLAAAFLTAGLVDEVVAYVAPVLLGAGASAVGDLGITGIDQAFRPRVVDVTTIGAAPDQVDVRITLAPPPTSPTSTPTGTSSSTPAARGEKA